MIYTVKQLVSITQWKTDLNARSFISYKVTTLLNFSLYKQK